jgi:hypothetical protein
LRAALASAALVLALHGWLLTGLPGVRVPVPGDVLVAQRAVQVRQILAAAPVNDDKAVVEAKPAQQPPNLLRPSSLPPTRHTPTTLSATPAHPRKPAPLRVPTSAAPSTVTAATATAFAPAAADKPVPETIAGPAASDGGTQPAEAPVYPTRLAPPATLHYALQRGTAGGKAVLRWSPDGGRYELSLRTQLPAAPNISRVSQGSIDAHGIAPERYAESRRGRELRAVNFRRESARITFSGPQVEHPLLPGAQDRLSWMLQLSAVMAADRSLEAAGQTVLLFVVGTRGDAEGWSFDVQGRRHIDLPAGAGVQNGAAVSEAATVDTVLLRREPRHQYDTLVEVWLDPARHHLPVRAHLTMRGESTQFVMEQLELP